MKLHDLRPAKGSHKPRTRVGRGIAAGQGKTAGRGTKGQKARAGGSIPPWFEGGQTPIHIRIPKLRGFRNRGKVEYEVVNLGRIGQLVELGALESGEMPGAGTSRAGRSAPITVNQEILRAAGLVSTLNKPLKVLGHGDVSLALFVVADAFSKSAVAKIEAAGGSVQVLEVPASPMAALMGTPAAEAAGEAPPAGPPGAKRPVRSGAPAKSRPAAAPDRTPAAKGPAAQPAAKATSARPAAADRPGAKAPATAAGPATEPVTAEAERATAASPAAEPVTAAAEPATRPAAQAEAVAASEGDAAPKRARRASPAKSDASDA